MHPSLRDYAAGIDSKITEANQHCGAALAPRSAKWLQDLVHRFNPSGQTRTFFCDYKKPVDKNGVGCHGVQQLFVGGVLHAKIEIHGLFCMNGMKLRQTSITNKYCKMIAGRTYLEILIATSISTD